MGRPRTPTKVLELRSSFKKNPKRGAERLEDPEPRGTLEPPQEFLRTDFALYPALLAIWREAVQVCWWLTAAEAAPLESYCRLKYKERRGIAKNADLTNLFKLYPVLGMTQDGRARFREARLQPNTKEEGRQRSDEWADMQEEARRLRAV